uniref:Uncharacterized protein n=1 Tax=Heliothis virescens TaxID=7102 RepID=A0A2A4JLC3_HELVI
MYPILPTSPPFHTTPHITNHAPSANQGTPQLRTLTFISGGQLIAPSTKHTHNALTLPPPLYRSKYLHFNISAMACSDTYSFEHSVRSSTIISYDLSAETSCPNTALAGATRILQRSKTGDSSALRTTRVCAAREPPDRTSARCSSCPTPALRCAPPRPARARAADTSYTYF